MLEQLEPQIVRLEIAIGIEGMHDPELIARAARRYVVALLDELERTFPQRAQRGVVARRAVHEREEHDVALVTLELRGDAGENAPTIELDAVDSLVKQRL